MFNPEDFEAGDSYEPTPEMKTRFVETEDEREVKEDGYFRGDSGFRSRDRRGDFHRRGDGFRGRRGDGALRREAGFKEERRKEGSNAVKVVLEETAAKEVFSIRREVSGKTVVKEGSNAVKAALGETAAEEVFSGVKAGFVSRALEAGPPAVFPAETGAINE